MVQTRQAAGEKNKAIGDKPSAPELK